VRTVQRIAQHARGGEIRVDRQRGIDAGLRLGVLSRIAGLPGPPQMKLKSAPAKVWIHGHRLAGARRIPESGRSAELTSDS
jgi:hypothetical protein